MIEPGTQLETRGFGEELSYLEGDFFAHIAAHNVIKNIVEAEKSGFDAAVIGCALDPGLGESRELVKMPVIGAGEACLHMASMLTAGRISFLVGCRKHIPRLAEKARIYGFESRIASWRVLDVGVAQMLRDREATNAAVHREARAAVEEDGAEVVCLGCTGLVGQAMGLQEELGVPVLDPVLIGIKMAEFQANLWRRFGISHSKIGGYEPPPERQLCNAYNASFGLVRKVVYHIKNR